MTCPLCGETCTCVPGTSVPEPATVLTPSANAVTVEGDRASARPKFVVSAPDEFPEPDQSDAQECDQPTPRLSENHESTTVSAETTQDSVPAEFAPPDVESWRSEVSARLSRYRARRRPRAPRYPSLRLKFEAPPARAQSAAEVFENVAPASAPSSTPLTCQALAMNPVEPVEEEDIGPVPETANESAPAPVEEPTRSAQVLAKILEFPRWSYAPPVPLNDLADPVVERPRILEVPEVVPPPPAMGGITIEDAQAPEP